MSNRSIMKDANSYGGFNYKHKKIGKINVDFIPKNYEKLQTRLREIRNVQIVVCFITSFIAALLTCYFIYLKKDKWFLVLVIALLVTLILLKIFCKSTAFILPNLADSKAYIKRKNSFSDLANCYKIFTIKSSHEIPYSRANAGCGTVVKTRKIHLNERKLPLFLKSHYGIIHGKDKFYCLRCGNLKMYFLPDFILLINGKMHILNYGDLIMEFSEYNFSSKDFFYDADLRRKIWKYVNNDGTPDLRFNNNYEIYSYRMGKIIFKSKEGLEIETVFSDVDAVRRFLRNVNDL